MKPQYYLLMQEPVGSFYYLKGSENGAFYTISPEESRNHAKGFLSVKAVQSAIKDFHVGIVKVSDKGIVRV